MTEIRRGSCHCGAVEFEVTLENGFENPRRCNCSLCKRKGAVMASVPRACISVIKGQDKLTLYQWNTKIAEHYFCSVCGIYTHHRRRSNPDECGFNLGCIDNVNPLEFQDVATGDGASMSLVE